MTKIGHSNVVGADCQVWRLWEQEGGQKRGTLGATGPPGAKEAHGRDTMVRCIIAASPTWFRTPLRSLDDTTVHETAHGAVVSGEPQIPCESDEKRDGGRWPRFAIAALLTEFVLSTARAAIAYPHH